MYQKRLSLCIVLGVAKYKNFSPARLAIHYGFLGDWLICNPGQQVYLILVVIFVETQRKVGYKGSGALEILVPLGQA
jgi:hypothetical protein